MAFVSKIRMDGLGASAAELEATFEEATDSLREWAAHGSNPPSQVFIHEQVISVDAGEPDGPFRFTGRRIVLLDIMQHE